MAERCEPEAGDWPLTARLPTPGPEDRRAGGLLSFCIDVKLLNSKYSGQLLWTHQASHTPAPPHWATNILPTGH